MPMSKDIQAYEGEWSVIAQTLIEKGTFTLPTGDKKRAAFYRLRFYGFRSALKAHDAGNPWLAALMETQATIDAGGNLVLTRSPLSALLRGLLEHSMVRDVPTTDSVAPGGDAHELALLEFLNKRT